MQSSDLILIEIDVRDLTGGVDAGIRTSRDHEPGLAAEDPCERTFERSLDRAQARLQRPPAEVRPVVGDVEPDAHRASIVAGLSGRPDQSSSSMSRDWVSSAMNAST
jgi:hypothetical protein